ncbi:two-on-two hemoglobin-3-like [Arachis stenosperma]|uniref:two-on-two hemoglobin-3-like n=1 Tax=Arachis stenosperma TaxID=217475 RepID=UPI0025AC48FD|nr:two-on-two hemoglobin-3-like [Arachis stenosperma]
MTMRKNGFVQSSLILRRKTLFKTNTNFSSKEWEALLSILREESGTSYHISFLLDVLAGHPALIGRHRPFPVTHQAAERWLHHMQQALDTTTDIDDDSKIKMMNFFRHTAYFLVAGDELKNQNQQVPCKHAAGR